MAASVLDGEITFFSDSRGDKITFVANKRQSISIGSNPTCDVRILGANDVHMTIQVESTGKVSRKRKRYSEEKIPSQTKKFICRHFKISHVNSSCAGQGIKSLGRSSNFD
jgi:hypothetical protein